MKTVVAISNCFVHLDGSIFPDPHSFKPERWLTPGAEILDTFLVSFSKGPRSCMGLKCVVDFTSLALRLIYRCPQLGEMRIVLDLLKPIP